MKKRLIAILSALVLFSITACSTSTSVSDDTVTVYVARHGKTILNSYVRVQGWIDSPLTDEGRDVAKYLGAGLNGIPFDRFYASDLGRQKETIQIIKAQIGQADVPVYEQKGLREAFFGRFEGSFDDEMFAAAAKVLGYKGGAEELKKYRNSGKLGLPEYLNAIAKADPDQKAETFDQVKARTQQSLHNMVQEALANGDKTLLAVSSGTAIQIMISDMTSDPARNKPLVNAAVVKIVYKNGQYTVEEIGTDKYIKLGMARLGK